MSKPTGGFAHPQGKTSVDRYGEKQYSAEGGLTIRDYFAAKAMQALIQAAGDNASARADVAEHAYGFADDMLAERKS